MACVRERPWGRWRGGLKPPLKWSSNRIICREPSIGVEGSFVPISPEGTQENQLTAGICGKPAPRSGPRGLAFTPAHKSRSLTGCWLGA